MSAWITSSGLTAPGSCVDYLTRRVERNIPFSPRLRRQFPHAIERICSSKLKVVEFEAVCLPNCLDVGVHNMEDRCELARLLRGAIRFPEGLKNLLPHYWFFLDKLLLTGDFGTPFASGDMEVARLLEEAEDWEELEV